MARRRHGRGGLRKMDHKSGAVKKSQDVTPQGSSVQGRQAVYHFEGQEFRGPLPPPQLLTRYNEAFPDCAERVVAMAEGQSNHRQQIESKVIESNISNERLGQWLAFLLAVAGMACGTFLLYLGKNASGLAVLLGPLGSIVILFLYSRTTREKSLKAKWDRLIREGDQGNP